MSQVPTSLESAPRNTDDKAVAQRVLEAESEAIRSLVGILDDTFIAVIDTLAGIRGKVVVTGMGKSGHIARKIAATLASTGTPAVFVHPGEASHGDLGMIMHDDAVLALSNHGQTAELSDVLNYCKRWSIPLIGMTRKARSVLADTADLVLTLPDVPEACPLGLAPTSSTTQMMALGDAIAVALLERNAFTASDFKVFHPGGQLGRRLQKVSDIMHGATSLPLIDSTALLSDAILTMTAKTFGCVGIVDEMGVLAGIITDGDLRRHMHEGLLGDRACSIMTPAPKTIRPSALAAEALATMQEAAITSLFVVDDQRPIGIVHIHDCLRAGVS